MRGVVGMVVAGMAAVECHAQTATRTANAHSRYWDTDYWTWAPTGSGYPNSSEHDAVLPGLCSIQWRPTDSFTVRDLTIQPSTYFEGSGTLTVHGSMLYAGSYFEGDIHLLGENNAWTAGALWTGVLTVHEGASLDITASDAMFTLLANRAIVNDGTVRLSSQYFKGGGPGVTNRGEWTFHAGAGATNKLLGPYMSSWPFKNEPSGTILKTGAGIVENGGMLLDNGGLLRVEEGELQSGFIARTGTTVQVVEGAKLWSSNVIAEDGVTFDSPAGGMQIADSTMQGTAIAVGSVQFVRGLPAGVHTLTGDEWRVSSTSLASTGVVGDTTIASGTRLLVSGVADLRKHTLRNDGEVVVGTMGVVAVDADTVLHNRATWIDEPGGLSKSYAGMGTFTNESSGSFTRSGGTALQMNYLTFKNSGLFDVRGTRDLYFGTFHQITGEAVIDGGTVQSGSVTIDGGRLQGSMKSRRPLVVNAGLLQPGIGIGTIEFLLNSGSLLLGAQAVTEIELAGADVSQRDRITSVRPVTLGGTLKVRFINDYVMQPCDEHVAITGVPLIGAFSAFDFPQMPRGRLNIRQEPGAIVITYLPSDHDGSGFVDIDDYVAFVHDFEAGDETADFDNSGFVDTDDFTEFVMAFEQGC